METTYPPIVIGFLNGKEIVLSEGKGQNDSVISYDGKNCRQGFAEAVLGKEIAEIYAAWFAAR